MNQGRAKHELSGVNFAHSAFDVEVPVGLDWHTVEDGHEGPDGEPDYGACLKDVDSRSDVGDAE